MVRRHAEIRTREMTAGDMDDVLVIEHVSFSIPWSREMFLEEIAYPFCHDLVAVIGEILVGYISFAVVCDEAHLRNVAVHRDWQRLGVASGLLSQMIVTISALGVKRVTLEVRESNRAALALYKRFGFVVEGVRPSYYQETGEDALIMWADV